MGNDVLLGRTRTGKKLHLVCDIDGTLRWTWCGEKLDPETMTTRKEGLVCLTCLRAERSWLRRASPPERQEP